jgi:hypothetical protein
MPTPGKATVTCSSPSRVASLSMTVPMPKLVCWTLSRRLNLSAPPDAAGFAGFCALAPALGDQ